MKIVDFHDGSTIEGAVERVHQIVGETRIAGDATEYQFITGHGVIKAQLIETLESYGIKVQEQLGNPGVIIALIE